MKKKQNNKIWKKTKNKAIEIKKVKKTKKLKNKKLKTQKQKIEIKNEKKIK